MVVLVTDIGSPPDRVSREDGHVCPSALYPSSARRQAHGARLSAAVRDDGRAQQSRGKWHTACHPPSRSRRLQSRKGRGPPTTDWAAAAQLGQSGSRAPGRKQTCGRSPLGLRSTHPAFLGKGPPHGGCFPAHQPGHPLPKPDDLHPALQGDAHVPVHVGMLLVQGAEATTNRATPTGPEAHSPPPG